MKVYKFSINEFKEWKEKVLEKAFQVKRKALGKSNE
jgi:hypothetical protein